MLDLVRENDNGISVIIFPFLQGLCRGGNI